MTPDRLNEIRALLVGATPGPWRWFGNTNVRSLYLATVHHGRRFVMQFGRWGTRDAAPLFHVVTTSGSGVMVRADEMVRYEAPYRKDVDGIDHPDAKLIEAAPSAIADLLAEVDRLTTERDEARADHAATQARYARAWEALCGIGEALEAAGYPQLLPERALRVGEGVAKLVAERDALRAQLAEAADPDNRYRAMLDWRGVGVPCATCGGEGRIGYANTATWRGGGGGCAMTVDVCDACWGSGDAERPGVDLRELTRLGASLHKAAAAGYDRCTADVVAWLHTGGPALAFASTIGGSEYTCAADAITNGAHIGAKERA